jgi:siderophore synthetase component
MSAVTALLKNNEAPAQDEHARYICLRVLDTLLREDVRGCMSVGEVLPREALPAEVLPFAHGHAHWLKVDHLSEECLWLPVVRANFMQSWRIDGLPIAQQRARVRLLRYADEVLTRFSHGLPEKDAALYAAFAGECATAEDHRAVCEAERARWFEEPTHHQGESGTWVERLLHFDRLGAFLDHPFYPTARAKLGFDAAALEAYAPEFQRRFELRWLAVPKALMHASVQQEGEWPAIWPRMADVGLDEPLASTHALVPVHPFVWEHYLEGFLHEHKLAAQTIRAPLAYLAVRPTLSVRTVVLEAASAWHLKLPLTIRTLGAKNIRTIKPSTIHDGHLIQTLLSDIVDAEPALLEHVLLTHEQLGAHVQHQPFLGYILRRYPEQVLQDATLVPVASLLAPTPDGRLVAQLLADRFYDGDLAALLDEYLDLTLALHLRLWLRYGIALESNQQNSVIVLSTQGPRLCLLLKDNDAARIHPPQLARRRPDLAAMTDNLLDRRICVDEALPLAQMFTTITLQLNIAVPIEGLGPLLGQTPAALYAALRGRIAAVLATLAAEGEEVALARQMLLEDERQYAKYLLVAATLAEKSDTGAADVNKYYGRSAPNFLRTRS